MFKAKSLLVLLAGVVGGSAAMATPIVVDGKPGDWLINPNTWASGLAGVHQTIEDQTGGIGAYLAPGWGGQAYDAEAIYALRSGDMLYIALFTGHDPETSDNPGANTYGAGDFAIDFGKDGTFEIGINVRPRWDTFGVAGGVYQVTRWAYGLWNDGTLPGYLKSEHPTSIVQGALLGSATLAISDGVTGLGNYKRDTHYFYEIGLDTNLLRQAGWDGGAFDIHWTQNCANDSIKVDPPSVPEPGTLALLPLGLVSLAALRRRKSA